MNKNDKIVCDCLNINFKTVKETVKEIGEEFIEVQEKTEIGTACGCCLQKKCAKTDMTLRQAIFEAVEDIENNID